MHNGYTAENGARAHMITVDSRTGGAVRVPFAAPNVASVGLSDGQRPVLVVRHVDGSDDGTYTQIRELLLRELYSEDEVDEFLGERRWNRALRWKYTREKRVSAETYRALIALQAAVDAASLYDVVTSDPEAERSVQNAWINAVGDLPIERDAGMWELYRAAVFAALRRTDGERMSHRAEREAEARRRRVQQSYNESLLRNAADVVADARAASEEPGFNLSLAGVPQWQDVDPSGSIARGVTIDPLESWEEVTHHEDRVSQTRSRTGAVYEIIRAQDRHDGEHVKFYALFAMTPEGDVREFVRLPWSDDTTNFTNVARLHEVRRAHSMPRGVRAPVVQRAALPAPAPAVRAVPSDGRQMGFSFGNPPRYRDLSRGASAYGTRSNGGERYLGKLAVSNRGRMQVAIESDLTGLGYRVIPWDLAVADGYDPQLGVPEGTVVTWVEGDRFVVAVPSMREAESLLRGGEFGHGAYVVTSAGGAPQVINPLVGDDDAAEGFNLRGRFGGWRRDREEWLRTSPEDGPVRRERNPKFHGPQQPGYVRGALRNGPDRLPPFAPGQDFEQLRRLDPERFAAVERAESSARLPPLAYGQGPYGGASSWSDAMYPDAGHGQLAGPTALRPRFGRRGP